MSSIELPKAYDPRPVEGKWYQFWESQGYFKPNLASGKGRFCVTIPPPNVNGELHMGHALQHCIHDLLARWHRMNGEAVLVVPGTDHASIATNRAVEKKLLAEGTSRQELGREEFLRRCWEWTHQVAGTIIRQLKSLGCSYDWDWGKRWTGSLGESWIGRFTMDEGYSRAVLEAFVRFYEKGWIYRGARVVNWCPQCQSTVSDLEVDHAETTGRLWHIRYPLADGEGSITVATTRPETMLGDTAVAVHAEDPRYQALIGKQVILPLMNRPIPVIGDATGYVDPAFGSGAVKVTPAHDLNDFEAGLRHKLPSIVVIGLDGSMTEDAGAYAGLDRYEARKRVVADLEAGGFLVKVENYSYAIGQHDRCDTVIEPLLSEQWFLSMKELARMTMEAIEGESPRVDFLPGRFQEFSLRWLDNIRDWNISRQIWWGHRIPIYYCRACGKAAAAIEPPKQCPCGANEFTQDEDTLDTWFSSALWPFAVLGWPDEKEFAQNQKDGLYPTSVLITAHEIIYLWVLRMIMTSLEFADNIPFEQVFIHPVVLDLEGRRMSKSLGIGLDPVVLIEQYGADATRFGILYQCGAGQDIRFGEERVEAARNFCNKIWNASRLVLSSLDEMPTVADLARVPEEIRRDGTVFERSILSRLARTTADIEKALEDYRLDEASRTLYDYFWGEFCDWFLEDAKPLLRDPSHRARVQRVLCFLLERFLRLAHPFLPHLTEEIWQRLPHEGESIMIAAWPEAKAEWVNEEAEQKDDYRRAYVTSLRDLRASQGIAAGSEIEVFAAVEGSNDSNVVAEFAANIASLVRAKTLQIVPAESLPKAGASSTVEFGDARVTSTISIAADPAALRQRAARLQTEQARLEKEEQGLLGKLSNQEFLSKAPAAIVEKTRGQLEENRRKQEAVKRDLASLEG